LFHNTFEHKQAVEGMGGRGGLPWNLNKDIYLQSMYTKKIIESSRKFEA